MSKRDAKKKAARHRREREQRRSATGHGLDRQLLPIVELVHDGRLEDARQQLDKLAVQHPSHKNLLALLTDVCVKMGDYGAALETCKRLASLEPHNADFQLMLGGLAMVDGRPALACRCFEQFLQLAPDDPRADGVSQTLRDTDGHLRSLLGEYGLGDEQMREVAEQHEEVLGQLRMGNARRACELADSLIQRLPAFASPWNNKAQALWTLGELTASAECSQHVLAEHPENFHALSNLLHAQVLLRHDEAARATAERLKQVQSEDSDLAARQTEALSFLGDDAGVVAIVEKFKRQHRPLNRGDAVMFHFGAAAAARLGDEARARKWWQRAIKANPAFEPALDNLDDLAKPEADRQGPWSFELAQLISPELSRRLRTSHDPRSEELSENIRGFVGNYPHLHVLLQIALRCGDTHCRNFFVNLASASESAGMLEAIKEFAFGKTGSYCARLDLAMNLAKVGELPTGSVTIWNGTAWAETMVLGFSIYYEPVESTLQSAAQDLIEKGYEALLDEDGRKAEELYRRALTLEPDSPMIMNNLTVALLQQGRDRESADLQDHIFLQFPDYWFGKVNRAHKLVAEGRLDEAEALLKPLLGTRCLHNTEFSGLAAAYINLLIAQGKYEGAQSWLNLWENADPDHPQLAQFRRMLQGSTFSRLAGRMLGRK